MTLNHYALDNWHHRLEAASQPVVYNFGLSVVTAAHLFSRMCNVGETWHFSPSVFPLVKLFSKLFIHCPTKYLLSSFSVPSSKTKKSKPHPCAQDAPSSEQTTQQTTLPVSWRLEPRGLLPKDSSLTFLLPSLGFEPLYTLLQASPVIQW